MLDLCILSFLFSLIGNRKTLYRISVEDNVVNVDVLVFSTVKYKYVIKVKDFQVQVRQVLFSYYETWQLKMYDKKLLIYRQKETLGWRKSQFMEIQSLLKSRK
jgi:hypothetical protein